MIASDTRSGFVGLVVLAALLLALAFDARAADWQRLTGYWQLAVEGAPRTGFLNILRVGPTGPAQAQAEAEIGLSRLGARPLNVDVTATGGGFSLRFVTPHGARVDLQGTAEGEFTGSHIDRAGESRPLRMTRIDDPASIPERSPALYVVKPGPEVPPECAAFSGLWGGRWLFATKAPLWLWVLEVDARCRATIAYMSQFTRPRDSQQIEIKQGAITVRSLAGGSVVVLRMGQDEIKAHLTSPHGDRGNSIQLTRLPDTLP